jgi:hypothetical protein
VYNVSGLLTLQQQLAERGDEYSNAVSWMSYQLNPRASIFRRDASRVEDVRSMRHLMRSNNYQNDKVRFLGAKRSLAWRQTASRLWNASTVQ